MNVLLSDISGEEISHTFIPEDARVIVGKVVLHTTAKEQVEILEFIAGLQKERIPELYSGEFEPFGNAQRELDAYYDYLKRQAETAINTQEE